MGLEEGALAKMEQVVQRKKKMNGWIRGWMHRRVRAA